MQAPSVPEQQPQQQLPPQSCHEDGNSFFSGVFGDQSLEPSHEQWDTAITPSEGVPQHQPQNDLFSVSSVP